MMTVTTCRGCGGIVDVARATSAEFRNQEAAVIGSYMGMLERLIEKASQPDEVLRKIKGMVEDEPAGISTTTIYFCPLCAKTMTETGYIPNVMPPYTVIGPEEPT